MSNFPGFPPETLKFLKKLQKNNNREWFAENKELYESAFLKPAFELIRSLEKPFAKIAPLLKVEAKKVGGSLMRIYKDTRFSKDKTPYKTNMGIHFRHQAGKDVHAPGVYLHISPEECFLGAGIWAPPTDAVRSIRDYMIENATQWKKAVAGKRFKEKFQLHEDRLKSAPRGFDKEHPLIDSLRLKSFIGVSPLSKQVIESESLHNTIVESVRSARPLMEFLCDALQQPY